MLIEMQFNSLHVARRFVECLGEEIARQRIIIWDQNANHDRVEEAIYALPLLDDLLEQRKNQLTGLQMEFFGGIKSEDAWQLD